MSKIIQNSNNHTSLTKQETVYNILRENIMNGHLKPGSRLVLKKIASELGVSEIPVREAIRILESQGLVTITPHSGAKVSALLPEDVEEMFSIRSVLEGYATKTATPHITPETIEELSRLVSEMEICTNTNDYAKLGLLNREFHSKIYLASPYKLLYKMIFQLWDSSERTRAIFSLSKKRTRESLREHKEILEAIKAGDADKAEKLVRDQKLAARDVMVSYLLKKDHKKSAHQVVQQ